MNYSSGGLPSNFHQLMVMVKTIRQKGHIYLYIYIYIHIPVVIYIYNTLYIYNVIYNVFGTVPRPTNSDLLKNSNKGPTRWAPTSYKRSYKL